MHSSGPAIPASCISFNLPYFTGHAGPFPVTETNYFGQVNSELHWEGFATTEPHCGRGKDRRGCVATHDQGRVLIFAVA